MDGASGSFGKMNGRRSYGMGRPGCGWLICFGGEYLVGSIGSIG